MRVLATATTETCSPSKVKEAHEIMQSTAAKQLQAGMLRTSVGESMFATAGTLVAEGALDDHCSDMLVRALDMTRNEIMPVQVESEVFEVRPPVILNGQAACLLQDAFGAMIESTQQRSVASLESAGRDYDAFCSVFARLLKVLNIVEWTVLQDTFMLLAKWRRDHQNTDSGDRIEDEDEGALDDEAQLFVEPSATLPELFARSFTRCPFMDLLSSVSAADTTLEKLSGLAQAGDLPPGVQDLRSLVMSLAAEARSRSSLMQEASHVTTLLTTQAKGNLEAFIQDWKQNGDNSTLGMVSSICRLHKADRTASLLQEAFVIQTDGPDERVVNASDLHYYFEPMLLGIPQGKTLVQEHIFNKVDTVLDSWLAADMTKRIHAPPTAALAGFAGDSSLGPWDGLLCFVGEATAEQGVKCFAGARATAATAEQAAGAMQVSSIAIVLKHIAQFAPPSMEVVHKVNETIDCALTSESLAHIVDTHSQATIMISLMSWLAKRYGKEANSCFHVTVEDQVSLNTIDPAVDDAMQFLIKLFDRLLDLTKISLQKQPREDEAHEFIPDTESPLVPLRQIVLAAQSLWLPLMQAAFGRGVVTRLQQISVKTTNLTPNWKFFIDDNKCNLDLAKRSLLESPSRVNLSKQVQAVHDTLISIASAFAAWRMPPPTEYQVTAREMKDCSDVLGYAKDTVAVIAAVSILSQPAAQRPALAAALLQAGLPPSFPASLRKELNSTKMKKQ